MTSPEQRIADISDEWLQMCAGCDAGMGPCTCPSRDPRFAIFELSEMAATALAEVASLRAQVARKDEQIAALTPKPPKPWPRCVICDHAAMYHLGHECEPGDCECDCGGYRPSPTEGEQHQ